MSKNQYLTVITSHHISLNQTNDEKDLAVCSITINNVLNVNGIRIISLNGSLNIKWALDSTLNADYRHIVHPIDPKFRSMVEKILIDAYKHMADNEKVKALLTEKEALRVQQSKARDEHRESLADALGRAIEQLDSEIQQL